MARIRSLKPEFWSDSNIVRLSFAARLFYQGMWTFALCDNGHLADDPVELRLRIFPADDVDGEELINELVDNGRIQRITISDGRKFLHVPTLGGHSKSDSRWSPRCPVCADTRRTSTKPPEPLPNSPTLADTRRHSPQERIGEDSNKRSPSTASRLTKPDDPNFARFWAAYPRKVGKGEARKIWQRLMKADVDPELIIAGAARYRDDPHRQRSSIEYTKHPGPWLNAERWTDHPTDTNGTSVRRGFWEN